jgi:polar amino acid transport system substrate-binding protein
MTKRAWWALTLLALALITWGGWTAYQRWQGRSGLAEIRQRGALRVGLDASFPPFESLDEDGQVVGLDADIARAIADDLGVEVQFVNIGFDGLYDALLIKRVDVLLSGLPIDPYRSRDVAYSVNYFNAGQVLVTRRDDIHTKMDTAGKSVAVEWGSLGDMEARRLQKTLPGLQINSQPDAQSALQFDTAIVDGVNAVTQPQMRVVTYLSNEWYAAAVAVNNRALLAEINKTLTRLIESGEMERLQKQRIMNGE